MSSLKAQTVNNLPAVQETQVQSLGCGNPLDLEMTMHSIILSFPGGSDGKESACNAEDPGSIPGLGRSPGEENGSPFQYSCLENSMDRRTWRATVHGVTKSPLSD